MAGIVREGEWFWKTLQHWQNNMHMIDDLHDVRLQNAQKETTIMISVILLLAFQEDKN